MPVTSFASTQSKNTNVDLEKRVIRGVVMAKPGVAKGHGVSIEASEIEKAYQQCLKMKTVPSNFEHKWNSLGLALGDFKDFRMSGGKLLGDLYISDTADKSPKLPGMGTYVLELAKEAKTKICASIKFEYGDYYQRDSVGQKITIWHYDSEGRWKSRIEEYGTVYLEIVQMQECDVVKKGALTEKLFSNDDQKLIMFNELINDPEFQVILETNHDKWPKLAEFYHKKSEKGFMASLKSFYNNHIKSKEMSKETQPLSEADQLAAANAKIAELEAAKPSVEQQLKDANAKIAELEAAKEPSAEQQLMDANAKIAELEAAKPSVEQQLKEAKAKIAELSAEPAVPPTSTATTEAPADTKVKAYHNMEIHAEARAKGIGKKRD